MYERIRTELYGTRADLTRFRQNRSWFTMRRIEAVLMLINKDARYFLLVLIS